MTHYRTRLRKKSRMISRKVNKSKKLRKKSRMISRKVNKSKKLYVGGSTLHEITDEFCGKVKDIYMKYTGIDKIEGDDTFLNCEEFNKSIKEVIDMKWSGGGKQGGGTQGRGARQEEEGVPLWQRVLAIVLMFIVPNSNGSHFLGDLWTVVGAGGTAVQGAAHGSTTIGSTVGGALCIAGIMIVGSVLAIMAHGAIHAAAGQTAGRTNRRYGGDPTNSYKIVDYSNMCVKILLDINTALYKLFEEINNYTSSLQRSTNSN